MFSLLKKVPLWFVAATLALSVTIPLRVGLDTAEANSVQTDSLGCVWSGDTWFTSIGWASTNGNSGCTQDSRVELHYYDNGAWGSTGSQTSGTWWIQWGHAATSIYAYHQIKVQGLWRQEIFTSQ